MSHSELESPERAQAISRPAIGAERGSILLIHGLTGTPDEFRELAEIVSSQGFRVYAPLLSGHGESVAQLRNTTLKKWKSDVAEAAARAFQAPGPHIIIGLSFGGLLALDVASQLSPPPTAVVVLSPPFRFRSAWRAVVLHALSLLPDSLLNVLPIVSKSKRRPNHLKRKHLAFRSHCVSAGARIMQLRKQLLQKLPLLQAPLLLVQDPFDHHLEEWTIEDIAARVSSEHRTLLHLPRAEHEITIGHRADELFEQILRFLNSAISSEVTTSAS